MGDIEKHVKRNVRALGEHSTFGKKGVGRILEKPVRTGATSKRREAADALEKQQQKESMKLAETESEIATKRAMAKSGKGGRQSLIKSSASGLSQNLGGTA